MKYFIALLVITKMSMAGFVTSAKAQAESEASPFWECRLPGGTYIVRVSAISSVSTHEYLVDGTTRVTEVTVASDSSVVARFYHIELPIPKSPVGVGQSLIDHAKERIEQTAERFDDAPVWQRVVKSYPLATHAHTVEYRIVKKKDTERIFKSLRSSIKSGIGRILKISDKED